MEPQSRFRSSADCEALLAVKKLPANHSASIMDQAMTMTIHPTVDVCSLSTSEALSAITYEQNIVRKVFLNRALPAVPAHSGPVVRALGLRLQCLANPIPN